VTSVSRAIRGVGVGVIRAGRGVVHALVAASISLALASPVQAASPTPSAGLGGDPRSSGQGPGLVGDPVIALVAVLAIGLGALVLTLLYLRLTARHDI
jgi:hypothetical protein